jgi:hypothetical protein
MHARIVWISAGWPCGDAFESTLKISTSGASNFTPREYSANSTGSASALRKYASDRIISKGRNRRSNSDERGAPFQFEVAETSIQEPWIAALNHLEAKISGSQGNLKERGRKAMERMESLAPALIQLLTVKRPETLDFRQHFAPLID